MISFKGYDETIRRIYTNKQEHIFSCWDELSQAEKTEFLNELQDLNFDLLNRLYTQNQEEHLPDFDPAPFIHLPENADEIAKWQKAREAGEEYIRSGRLAAFVVAGGQGTRLGYEGPKGKFPVGAISNKTLFQLHAEKIRKYSGKYGVSIPFLVMTSDVNHSETRKYFQDNGYFGLDEKDIFIFQQKMIPSLDIEGNLILKNKNSIFQNPDGHGGSLTALAETGILKKLGERGIDTISYFQVDNPLVRIIDPVFIGYHVLERADLSSKMVKKTYPEEKVGLFVRFKNGRTGVVEYSDMSEEKIYSRDASGSLLYAAANIAIHLFERKYIERITSGGDLSLPYHVARKKIKAFIGRGVEEIDGYKFEKFVFDALPLTDKNLVFETLREEEFAPVKNASGVDSVASAREMMERLQRGWLEKRGIAVPPGVRTVEISPLVAVEAEDLGRDIILKAEGESLHLEVNS